LISTAREKAASQSWLESDCAAMPKGTTCRKKGSESVRQRPSLMTIATVNVAERRLKLPSPRMRERGWG
jgi:hypothetical protein